jgi:hypothetical protein
VQNGKAKIAAIAAPRRTPLAPEIPSATEAGYPTLGYESTVGFYGPAGMPLDLRKRIAADVIDALQDPVVAKRLFTAGMAVIAIPGVIDVSVTRVRPLVAVDKRLIRFDILHSIQKKALSAESGQSPDASRHPAVRVPRSSCAHW